MTRSTGIGAAGRAPRAIPKIDAFVCVFGAALLANALVVARARYWPMGDLGGHIELMDIMMRYDSPATSYRETYVPPGQITANSLLLFFAKALGGVTDAFGATRVVLVSYVIAVPLSVLALCHAFGRSRWLALLAVPMAYSSVYGMGFLNYLVGVPILVSVFALARVYGDRGDRKLGIALAVALVVLFWAHIITFLIGFGIVAFVLVVSMTKLADTKRLLTLVPCMLPLGEWASRNLAASDAPGLVGADGGLGLVFNTPEYLIENMHAFGMRLVRDAADEYVTIAIVAIWLFAMAVGGGRMSTSEGSTGRLGRALREYTLEIVTVCSMIAYFALPSHMNEMNTITERVVSLTMLFFVAWPRLRFDGGDRALLAPMIALPFVYAFVLDARHQAFEARYYEKVPAAIAALPDRSRLAYLFTDRENEIFYQGSLWHMPRAIHAVRNGGTANDNFAIRSYTPVQYRPSQLPVPLSARGFEHAPDLARYDAVLLRTSQEPLAAVRSPRLRLLFHDGEWWLFSVRENEARARERASAPR